MKHIFAFVVPHELYVVGPTHVGEMRGGFHLSYEYWPDGRLTDCVFGDRPVNPERFRELMRIHNFPIMHADITTAVKK